MGHSSLLQFYVRCVKVVPGDSINKHSLMLRKNKLECFALENIFIVY